MTDWKQIQTGGTFATFTEVGDKVEGTIVSASLTDGSDFDGKPCPLVVVKTADGLINVTCSLANLRTGIKNAFAGNDLQPGGKILFEMTGFYETGKGSQGKSFTLKTAPPELTDVSEF